MDIVLVENLDSKQEHVSVVQSVQEMVVKMDLRDKKKVLRLDNKRVEKEASEKDYSKVDMLVV